MKTMYRFHMICLSQRPAHLLNVKFIKNAWLTSLCTLQLRTATFDFTSIFYGTLGLAWTYNILYYRSKKTTIKNAGLHATNVGLHTTNKNMYIFPYIKAEKVLKMTKTTNK